MKSNKKNIIVLILLVMGFLILPSIKFDFSEGQKNSVINPKKSAGYSESFIHVDGNWSDTKNDYDWCYGSGTWQEPYVIENVTVDCGGTGSGIFIENSDTDYFIIRNCTVYNSGSVWEDAGIKLANTNNGTLTFNNCSNNNAVGIFVFDSNNNNVSGNIVNDNNDVGIVFMNSHYNNITGNTAKNNLNHGIYIDTCNNDIISGNTANNNIFKGIIISNCNNNTISGNTANDNNDAGIGLIDSNNNIISGNTACNNETSSQKIGIKLNICNNNTISGNTANNNTQDGIYLDDSDNNTISGNTANNNTVDAGIYLSSSNDNTISGNTVCNNTVQGIILTGCNDNTISENTANDNYDGIFLDNDCINNIISGNTANNNTNRGIIIEDRCDNNTISGNTANDNTQHGISLVNCDNNTITENVLYNNTLGIQIDSNSDNNSIYENFFLENGKHAEDYGTDNKWNSTSIGNYWDNWTSPDVSPNDGIVDVPYPFIGGSVGSIDYFPIAEDGAPSIKINSPTSSDVFGVTAPSFDVTITDDYLDEKWYTIDGGINNYTFIENGIINQTAWAAKTEGDVTITFYASDIPRNIGIAEVSVAKDTTAPIIVINSPAEGDRFGKNAPLFNITVTENNLDLMWYSFDGGLTTFAFINNTVFNQTAWTALDQGNVTIMFYARDLAGNEASESVTVIKSVPSGLDPGVIITIVVISIVGGVAVITVVYIFMKKRATPE